MDYFGSFGFVYESVNECLKFQSFWVNGLLWKPFSRSSLVIIPFCFNPSGSMDYFGRFANPVKPGSRILFQSFWVNGLLWKLFSVTSYNRLHSVSILLGQWITLEGLDGILEKINLIYCFNPSGSMDYFGRSTLNP